MQAWALEFHGLLSSCGDTACPACLGLQAWHLRCEGLIKDKASECPSVRGFRFWVRLCKVMSRALSKATRPTERRSHKPDTIILQPTPQRRQQQGQLRRNRRNTVLRDQLTNHLSTDQTTTAATTKHKQTNKKSNKQVTSQRN